MEVLVDTGATNSIIQETSLSKIQHSMFKPVQQKFFLANKTSTDIIGYLSLEIKIQHIRTNVIAAITKTLCCDLILGEDWIKCYQVTINRFKDRIEILGNKATVSLRTSFNNKLMPIKLQHSMSIPPHTERMVDAFVAISTLPKVFFSPDLRMQGTKKIIVTQVDHDYQYHNNDKFVANSHVPKKLRDITKSNKLTQQALSVKVDVEKTLDLAVQHIVNLQEKNDTRKIIQRYRKFFDTSASTIALTTVHHTIPTADHQPINSVPYRGPLQQQEALRKIVKQMERSKLIRPSTSPWSSPVLLIKKKDGDYRLVVDYRKLNAITTKDSFPIPTIESTLQQPAGNAYFSKLDLRSGYFQIPINENDKPKTAFITTAGLWKFNVLPMGLTNAPPSFQRIMYNVIAKGREDYCLVYLDDIIIFSKTFEDHLKQLDEILKVLNNHRFQLNPIKCSIIINKIDYLGHSIDEYGITPLHDNIKAIRESQLPDYPTLKQANEFIGGIGFYRNFIRNFAKIAGSIHRVTNLTKNKKHKFIWGDEQRQAVQQLKMMITGPELVLEFPDPELPFILSTDASQLGLGAVLKQMNRDGKLKVIDYLSRVLSKSESRYSTTELEALATVWAVGKLRSYLLGKDFTVETDNCPLCQFHKKKSRNGRLDRWSIDILSEYNITEIKYKKGKCHCNADLLSRYPLHTDENSLKSISLIRKQDEGYLFRHVDELDDGEPELQPRATINVITRSRNYDQATAPDEQTKNTSDNSSPKSTTTKIDNTRFIVVKSDNPASSSTKNLGKVLPVYSGFSMTKLKEEQMKDVDIQKKITTLVINDTYEIIDGVIYKLVLRGTTKIKLPWIPKSMINQVMFLYHDHHTAAHLGSNKTSHKLINKYYWPNMHLTINDYIKASGKCTRYNCIRTKRPGKMNIMPTPNEVMGLVGMDYWGPTNYPTARGNRYVITMTDYLSKFAFARAVKTNSAQEAADFFLNVCYHYGAPSKLITNQGSHFVAELTRTIIESCNTTHILATPYHPTSNAQTERFNATFAPALSKLTSGQTLDWDNFLQPVIYAYNTSKYTTTSLTPFQIMFTRENQLIMNPKQMKISLMKPNEYYEKTKQSRVLILDYVKLNIKDQHQLAKSRYDKNRPDPKYVKSDLVLVRVINRTSKFQEKFEGPYRISDQIGPATFIVKIENPDNDENTNYTKQVTTADMKHIFSFEVV
ncbi:unnamed protein product [Rotaria socialis]